MQKIYGEANERRDALQPRGVHRLREEGSAASPNPKHISTSYVERQNLTMRMHMRRFTRLTNGFSKKVENHAHAVALHFMYYNFGRVHQTLRVTPAMEAGVVGSRLEPRRHGVPAGLALSFSWLNRACGEVCRFFPYPAQ